LNKPRALDYLYHAQTDHTEESLFKGVYSIPPSHYVFLDVEKVKENVFKLEPVKWYNVNIIKSKQTFKEAKNEFLNKFKDSVELHLRADVPIGSALSGGLDSSSIVSYINILLKKENKTDLQKTFSSCSEDPRYDERSWMEEVVKETLVDGHYVYPKGEDVFKLTEKLIWFMDEPYQSQSAFLGYHVFMEAKKNNVVVLLNGQGADEYLSGYGAYKRIRQNNLIKKFEFKQLYAEINKPISFIRFILVSILNKFPSVKQKISPNIQFKNVINHKILGAKSGILNYNNINCHVNISKMQLLVDPLPRYLRWEDRNSMAHSVEARVPFLDYRLIEFVHSLPLNYLDAPHQSKHILVEALKGILPEKVRNRKDKKGFITPEQKWFMTEFCDDFIKLFEDNVIYAKGTIDKQEGIKYLNNMQKGKVPFDYSYWRITLFCVWMKTFNVEID
jgi:asparagine synthase (glutamine-hydrolysing)